MLRRRLIALAALAWVAIPGFARAAQPSFELAVKHDRLFGSTRGALVFAGDAVEFRTPDRKDGRRWSYPALKQVRVLGPTRIVLDTYEDRGRLRMRGSRSYEFEVVEGRIPRDLVTLLLEQLERPVVTTIMPTPGTRALFRIPVRHQRHGRGSEGTVLLYPNGLVYVTDRDAEARYWRFRDLFAVLQLDRHRLQVVAYEGDSGETRPYTFELKSDLSAAMYDALWERVNAPALAGRARPPDRAATPVSPDSCSRHNGGGTKPACCAGGER